jgi:soluble lytic murein transglycosylase-like protein
MNCIEGCISSEDHNRIVHRVNFWHVSFHIVLVVILAFSIYVPYRLKHERDHLQRKYSAIEMRERVFEILKARPLTLAQAMDITDAVLQQKRVPVEIPLAVMAQESEFRPKAVSKKGAKGLMQVMPFVWRDYALPHSKDEKDPVQNVRVGIVYLGDLFDRFHDWKAVLRAYYAGPQNHNNKRYNWYANAVLKKVAEYRREIGD